MADKVTMADFEKRLADGRYNNLTGARRGIGKMAGWSDKERALANDKANAHFGEGTKASKPVKAAKTAPKKAKTKAAPKVKAAKQPVKQRAKRAAKAAPAPQAPVQMELPIDEELIRAHRSIKKSEAQEMVLKNLARTRDLGGPDAEIKKSLALLTRDLFISVQKLVDTAEAVQYATTKETPSSAGDNGSSKNVDTSVADAALAAAAAAARAAVAKGPPAIPPLMGRQG